MDDDWLKPLVLLAKKAGAEILKYFGLSKEDLHVMQKEDRTPVTEADLSAHKILQKGLTALTPTIPILSEEGKIPPYAERQKWDRYWLLDPLDGTRGFIENRDEFTVNIALIERHEPVMGVVYAPVFDLCYFASRGQGAFKQVAEETPISIQTRKMDEDSFSVLLGQYLRSPRLPELFNAISGCEIVRLNSSLKFCWIAEGKGDLYPRLGDTSEWDTGAGHCVLNEAGGAILELNGKELRYNEKNSLMNPAFVAIGDVAQKEKVFELLERTP
ncbi:3'(2'),5'-bisphosphate nucleotidase CysQ [Coxiella burnetii]|uniref:3'(2'),5'-bisphosphate nucleotidase CysQ n=1 Tax=Coxiella burnetii (strain Dugway 5J108-111) TaxID=434922 RepID=A9KGG9_COXBN|nr:3'(2'),5'-bisphosphate nucleotidase CysQ [Coxiella burnetii]ABS77685.1 3'(2'),5'-bisphosphate nucleotidase [Coxiella burnetii Dugway 5J108-111]ACJ20425.1 3'(2'),5'-bisphosphate nucleotidase [Coxiella burnetii CbuK_Q154]ATN86056.1 3'(2'),5'-bisphosphate nucleotidase CysQ [Coxiella burnetii str. Schperling]EAX31945.1 3'(2'),5'-bisphosphate nucleotidase [Coxiella burnetii 'MSU Goat Q177']EDR35222.1 3'(2'),5'-bisphosphate nucleotidase [Coxiella burnetii Q321]